MPDSTETVPFLRQTTSSLPILLATLAGGLLGASLPAAQPGTGPPPVGAFTGREEFRSPKLSPDGSKLAVTRVQDFRDALFIIDLATFSPTPAATFDDTRLLNLWWKGNDLLLLLLEYGGGIVEFKTLDLTTKKARALHQFNDRGGAVVNPLTADPSAMIVSTWSSTGVNLRRLDVRTGRLEPILRNPGYVDRWFTDREGHPLAGLGRLDGNWFMLLREGISPWRRIELGDRDIPDFWPVAVFSDQRRILGFDYKTGDKAAAVVWDPATDAKEEIWRSDEVDADSILVWGDDETRPRAVSYEADRPRALYLTDGDRALADEIDRALPDTTNGIVSISADESKMVIQAYSDIVAAEYHLLDRKSGRLLPLGSAYPTLSRARMTPSRHFTFPGRDGRMMTGRAYVPHSDAEPAPSSCSPASISPGAAGGTSSLTSSCSRAADMP